MKEFFGQYDIKRLLKYALYLFLALVTQNMLFTQIRPLGICPLILPAVAISVGMFEGAQKGTVFGLIMGIFADMAFVENTLMFTLLFPALGFASGFVSTFYINRRFFAFMGLSLMASLLTAFVQMMAVFAKDGWSGALVTTALLQTIWSLPVSAVAFFPPARWIE